MRAAGSDRHGRRAISRSRRWGGAVFDPRSPRRRTGRMVRTARSANLVPPAPRIEPGRRHGVSDKSHLRTPAPAPTLPDGTASDRHHPPKCDRNDGGRAARPGSPHRCCAKPRPMRAPRPAPPVSPRIDYREKGAEHRVRRRRPGRVRPLRFAPASLRSNRDAPRMHPTAFATAVPARRRTPCRPRRPAGSRGTCRN